MFIFPVVDEYVKVVSKLNKTFAGVISKALIDRAADVILMSELTQVMGKSYPPAT